MNAWVTRDAMTLDYARKICRLFDYELDWANGTQGIKEFYTRNRKTGEDRLTWGRELDKQPYHHHAAEFTLASILKEVMGL